MSKPNFRMLADSLCRVDVTSIEIELLLEQSYLEGRKAQVKVDAEIARSEHSMPVEQWMQPTKKKVVSNFAEVIAKAIESQVIE